MVGFQTKILRVLRSPQFFAAILILFFIESAWIAISAAYPMVFDENAHFTVIQAYAHHLNPFFPTHSTLMDSSGAVSRNPSFLYRWLMSFPYRIISWATGDQMMQVIDLRFLNIFMFGGALILFRKLLLKTKVSEAIINVALLFFVMAPVVPLLAGQVNYDNLVMLVTAGALLMTVNITETITRTRQLPIARCIWLLTLCLLGSLVQFEFLPIFAAIVFWLGWQSFRAFRRQPAVLIQQFAQGWQQTSRGRKLFITIPFVIAFGVFTAMYGVNLVRYHDLTPQCGQVLTVQQCSTNGTWVRNQVALAHKGQIDANPVRFGASWTYRMFLSMFYTSSGGASAQANYLSINPLPLIFFAALGVFGAGVALIVRYHRALFEGYEHLTFLLFASMLYTVALWFRNYHDFATLGIKIAINGRYLFPIALPCMVLIALAFRQFLGDRERLRTGLLVVVFVLFLQGGGALTYIFYSNDHWYWQNSVPVHLNQTAQQLLKPFILVKSPLKSFGASRDTTI